MCPSFLTKVQYWIQCHYPLSAPQVPGTGPAVHIPGLTAPTLRLHPRPGPQAAALLPQLHRNHAQRGRGREAGHPGVPAPVSGPPLELHYHRRQPGHLRARPRQRYCLWHVRTPEPAFGLVRCGRCNRLLQPGWLITASVFLAAPEASMVGRGPLPGHGLFLVLTWQRRSWCYSM